MILIDIFDADYIRSEATAEEAFKKTKGFFIADVKNLKSIIFLIINKYFPDAESIIERHLDSPPEDNKEVYPLISFYIGESLYLATATPLQATITFEPKFQELLNKQGWVDVSYNSKNPVEV